MAKRRASQSVLPEAACVYSSADTARRRSGLGPAITTCALAGIKALIGVARSGLPLRRHGPPPIPPLRRN